MCSEIHIWDITFHNTHEQLSNNSHQKSHYVQQMASLVILEQFQPILTPASKTKKGRRNYIENLPDNLWASNNYFI